MATETAQTYKISFKFDESFKKLAAFQKEFKKGSVDQLKALDRAKASTARMAIMQDKAATDAHRAAQAAIKESIATAKTADELRNVVARQRAILKAANKTTNQYKKQNFLLQKMQTSSKQIAGNWISAFAVVGAGVSTVRVGQDMQAVEATLLSVSDGSEDAARSLAFVRREAFRLGGDLRNTAKDYGKLLAASKDQITKKQTEELFTGLMEASVVLGTSADDSSGALRALSQMLGKTKVTAEELRQQLGDRMPRAVPLMAQAAQDAGLIGSKVKQGQLLPALNKLMESGKLLTKDIMPAFTKRLREFAAPSLEKALKSNRVAMNQFKFSMQDAQNQVFTGKFEEGLTELFQTLGTFFQENEELWKSLGKILGSVFSGISNAIKTLKPLIDLLSMSLEVLTSVLGDFSGALLLLMSPTIFGAVLVGFKSLFTLIMTKGAVAMTMLVGKFALIAGSVLLTVGLLEELYNYLAGNDIEGLVLNTKSQIADRAQSGSGGVGGALAAFSPHMGGSLGSSSVVVKNVNIIDGEVIGESVAKSDAMNTMVENKQFMMGAT